MYNKEFMDKYNSHIPEDFRKAMSEFDEFLAHPQWERFMSNNHERITNTMQSGDAFNVMQHIGKPLSVALWRQLVGSMKLENFRIYKPDEGVWLDGRSNAADIFLDDNDCVRDITIFPDIYRGESNHKETIYYEVIGEAVINDYAIAKIDIVKDK